MVIDGKLIADELKRTLHQRVRALNRSLSLALIVVEPTPEILRFVSLKQRFGKDIGIRVDVVDLPRLKHDNEHLFKLVLDTTRTYDGMVLQLPLPRAFDREQVLNLFPLSHDVDVIGTTAYQQFEEGRLPFMPPVTAAFAEVLNGQGIVLAGRRVLVVGEGRLVGGPAAIWATRMGAFVTQANSKTENLIDEMRQADVLILGAGVPGLVTADCIKPGAIVLDAGTSEEAGILRGDADPGVQSIASIFTPTPGGIGPITVAKVFENLLTLDELKHRNRPQ